MLPNNLAFVDIETTGSRSFYDRIIEVGILRVEDNKLVKTFQSLVNPQTHLPREIELLTGISAGDVENAPTFRQIKDEILGMLVDCVFVAHNVRFDYSFIKNEFIRENISFSSKHFCTVHLSQFLFPKHKHHNLDALIERHNLPCENRHRAFDDAKVLFHFYEKLQSEIATEKLVEGISKGLKKPSLPLRLELKMLENLPEKPGVYIFYGEKGMPLYVGKSKNIRERILSHFSSDIHSPTEMKISQQIESIETTTTSGELGALFLESKLIKKLLPLYNKKSRIKKELLGMKSRVNKDGFQEVFLETLTTIDPKEISNFLGFFRSRRQAKSFLAEMAKKYQLCEKLLGLENTKGACFAYRLSRCKGACVNAEKTQIYNMKVLMAFSGVKIQVWPFDGPIIIEEQEMNGKKDYFLVDKWCYLGNLTVDEQGNKKSDFDKQFIFDLDIYQILRQFVKSPQNRRKIREVSSANLVDNTA